MNEVVEIKQYFNICSLFFCTCYILCDYTLEEIYLVENDKYIENYGLLIGTIMIFFIEVIRTKILATPMHIA